MPKIKRRYLAVLLILVLILCSSISCKRMNEQLLFNRARNFHDQGKLDQAIEIYKKLADKDGDGSEVRYDLGVAYIEKGEMDLAREQSRILSQSGRKDLAQVLDQVIRDGNSRRVRKNLDDQYQNDKRNNKD